MAEITNGRWLNEPPPIAPLKIGHDTRESLKDGLYVAIRGHTHDGHDFLDAAIESGAVMALVDREVESSIPCLLVSDTLVALSALAARWRDQLAGTRVFAITGTAGKTTTKDLLHHVLGTAQRGSASPASWNNAIGGPMSLLRARPGDDYVVLEMGTSSPGEIAALARCARPDVSIITLIGHGHLEGLTSLDGVRAEKLSLLDFMAPGGTAIVHQDDSDIEPPPSIALLRHGASTNADPRLASRADGVLILGDGARFSFPMAGRHQAVNAVAVIAAARIAGLSDAAISHALETASPSRGRGAESVVGGVRFIDDAYNANPESVAAALEAFPELTTTGRRIVILGDMLELGDQQGVLHEAIARPLLESNARASIDEVLLVGPAMASLAAHSDMSGTCPVSYWKLLDDAALHSIAGRLAAGDLVLIKASRGMRLERIVEWVGNRESEAATA
ncbi:MAG: UDP-N-acetylmuramoyl-tripeptide--D-alanyl-D-alanine ligase [Planctomycetota bacterium]|nr:UDP-N-acetylmuramoyl-tripeptide--D-alanyl-D-alanine ligase [Planctomycetota bacterium]